MRQCAERLEREEQEEREPKYATDGPSTVGDLRDRPDYDEAIETIRRFERMTAGSEQPIRILRESTRGTWTRARTSR